MANSAQLHAALGLTLGLPEQRPSAIWLETEPHSRERLWPLAGLPAVEMKDLLCARGFQRRASGRAALERVRAAIVEHEPQVVIFDTTEGWLSTTLCFALASEPDLILVGLQHGLMEVSALKLRPVVLRIRRALARVAWRVSHSALVGVGFGNNPFTVWVVFGETYAQHVRRLNPGSRAVVAFPLLSPVGCIPTPPRVPLRRIAFFDQSVNARESNPSQAVLDQLHRLACAAGLELFYRPHPKGVGRLTLPPRTVLLDGSPYRLFDQASGGTVVVSYFSTILVEAAWLGLPILAIGRKDCVQEVYEPFEGVLPLDRFLGLTALPAWSSVKPGQIESDIQWLPQAGAAEPETGY